MKDLEQLLKGNVKKIDEQININDFKITLQAYAKSLAYAKLAVKVAERDIECGGYMVAPIESKENLVTDVFLAKDQKVGGGKYFLSPQSIREAGKEAEEKGYKILGWWHSHGKIGFTTFSGIDEVCQLVVLNNVAPSNFIVETKDLTLKNLEHREDGDKTYFFEANNPHFIVGVDSKKETDKIKNILIRQEVKTGFSYGLVVNVKENPIDVKPYIEVAKRELCGACLNSYDESKPCNMIVVESGTFSLDETKLEAEVKERVNFRDEFALLDFNKWFQKSTYQPGRVLTEKDDTLQIPQYDSSKKSWNIFQRIIDYFVFELPDRIKKMRDKDKDKENR